MLQVSIVRNCAPAFFLLSLGQGTAEANAPPGVLFLPSGHEFAACSADDDIVETRMR